MIPHSEPDLDGRFPDPGLATFTTRQAVSSGPSSTPPFSRASEEMCLENVSPDLNTGSAFAFPLYERPSLQMTAQAPGGTLTLSEYTGYALTLRAPNQGYLFQKLGSRH